MDALTSHSRHRSFTLVCSHPRQTCSSGKTGADGTGFDLALCSFFHGLTQCCPTCKISARRRALQKAIQRACQPTASSLTDSLLTVNGFPYSTAMTVTFADLLKLIISLAFFAWEVQGP